MKISNQIIIYLIIILTLGLGISSFLYFKEINKKRNLQKELSDTKIIANNNEEALYNTKIELKVTKEQLEKYDTTLTQLVDKVNKIAKTPVREIIRVEPQYTPTKAKIDNKLLQKDSLYGLAFSKIDSVLTIEGVSWFKYKNNIIEPGFTEFLKTKFNFNFVITKHIDKELKVEKIEIIPFFINSDGTLGEPISKDLLTFNYRGAEILEKPWTPNTESIFDKDKRKLRIEQGFALTLTPIGLGLYSDGVALKYGYVPSIGFSYYFTVKKN